jgi:hypothetical protein
MAACAAGAVSSRVFACGFEGVFDGSFGYVHPRSIEVALAVRKAVGDGVLPEEALAPLVSGSAGLWRATDQLNRFGRKLSAAKTEAPTAVSNIAVLLSESALWARYVATHPGFNCLVHIADAEPTDVVVVSDLAVLSALNGSRLTMTEALARSLIIVDATGPTADAVAALLMATSAGIPILAVSGLEDRTAWGRSGRSTRD